MLACYPLIANSLCHNLPAVVVILPLVQSAINYKGQNDMTML